MVVCTSTNKYNLSNVIQGHTQGKGCTLLPIPIVLQSVNSFHHSSRWRSNQINLRLNLTWIQLQAAALLRCATQNLYQWFGQIIRIGDCNCLSLVDYFYLLLNALLLNKSREGDHACILPNGDQAINYSTIPQYTTIRTKHFPFFNHYL